MNKGRLAGPLVVVAGCLLLGVAPGLTRAHSGSSGPVQIPKVVPPGAQQKGDSFPADDFAGLHYTDAQQAEIDRIHRETKSREEAVAKDDKLSADQKDAMLLGYTRMEYGQVYKVLTPEQQRQVRQRIHARRAADQESKRKQPPRN